MFPTRRAGALVHYKSMLSHIRFPSSKVRLIKKRKRDYVKIKLCRYPASGKLYMCEFKMVLFDNVNPEGQLFFVQNFKIMIEAPGRLIDNVNIIYIYTLLGGESLREFDYLCIQIGITTIKNLNQVILGLGKPLFPVNSLSKRKLSMRRGMGKLCELKMIC